MKTKLMFVLMAFSIVAWAGASVAADSPKLSTDAGQGGGYVSEPNRADIIIWCNDVPAGGGSASQSDPSYPFEAWVADDYTSPGDEAVEKIQWWGVHFNNPTPVVLPTAWVINFYDDPGNCNPGLSGPGIPATPLFQRIITAYTAIDLGDGVNFEYTADLDGLAGDPNAPVPQDANRVYWISIQAVLDFNPNGQWGWTGAASVLGCSAVQMFPLLGTEDWVLPGDPPAAQDMAFCLYYVDDPIPVEASSWGSVKALFN